MMKRRVDVRLLRVVNVVLWCAVVLCLAVVLYAVLDHEAKLTSWRSVAYYLLPPAVGLAGLLLALRLPPSKDQRYAGLVVNRDRSICD